MNSQPPHVRDSQLEQSEDPAVNMVARRTIELAKRGERDPILLREAVLKSFRNDPGAPGYSLFAGAVRC
jgi:hypothetical protein